MNRLLILTLLFCLLACNRAELNSSDVTLALEQLDLKLAKAAEFEQFKEQRLLDIKSKAAGSSMDEELYWLYDDLYNEYNKYDLDSAACYLEKKQKVAERCGNESMILKSAIDAADKCVISGMYYEAMQITDMIDTTLLARHSLLPKYYHVMNSLYYGLAYASDNKRLHDIYLIERSKYRDLLYDNLGDNDIAKVYVKADMLIEARQYDMAMELLKESLSDENISTHDYAVVYYMIALTSRKLGDIEQAVIYYAQSACFDISTPIREYKSLYELAEVLYEYGDYERAYRYITRSTNDAKKANARLNQETIHSLLPIISYSYNNFIERNNRLLVIMLICIGSLLILLIIVTLTVIKNQKRIAATERTVREAYSEVKSVNERLQRYIHQLRESNEIKEVYIGRYIDLCSDYIGRLEEYRSELRKLGKTGGMDAIQQELRSSSIIEHELGEFYSQFDATFLDLFPDFIPQLNGLLQPDKQIDIKGKDNLLTTELRICALIRLGVTDSVKIAEFLRRSVSTIYNYRVKMRNAAVSNREEFEKEIMKIGKQI